MYIHTIQLHLIWFSIFVCIIALGDVWVSEHCQLKPTPCVSSIADALLNYPSETSFNIDANVNWTISGEFNILLNHCQMKFENVTIVETLHNVTFIADNGNVFVIVNDCEHTEHKYWISENAYMCLQCPDGTYTLDSTKCKPCPKNMKCENNEIIVQQYYHAFLSKSIDPSKGLQLETALCPTGYCCNRKQGCSYDLGNGDLCGKNRNSSVRMCGKCLDGYSETTSLVGNCRKCSYWEGKIMPIAYIFIASLAMFAIFSLSAFEREVPSPLGVYCNRTLLFYFQTLSFISFRSYIP
eukprot:294134_1